MIWLEQLDPIALGCFFDDGLKSARLDCAQKSHNQNSEHHGKWLQSVCPHNSFQTTLK
jgi:hypothetical protein